MNLHERNMVVTTISEAIINYRTGPWGNTEIIDFITKALDAQGLFKDPLAPVKAPTTTSEHISGSEAMSYISVECDSDSDEYPYLYCTDCQESLDTEVTGQYLSYLIVGAAAHWKENHS